MALEDMGYEPKGIRIDSGDLAYLSTWARRKFEQIAEKYETIICTKLISKCIDDFIYNLWYSFDF